MAVYKVNVSFDPELLAEIDAAAEELGVSRSGFVAEASARYVTDLHTLSAEELRRKDVERAKALFRRVGEQVPPGFDFAARLREDRERGGSAR